MTDSVKNWIIIGLVWLAGAEGLALLGAHHNAQLRWRICNAERGWLWECEDALKRCEAQP